MPNRTVGKGARESVASAVGVVSGRVAATTSWEGVDLSAVVTAANAGAQEAMDVLFARLRPAIVAYCQSRVQRQHHADIVQDICVAVLEVVRRPMQRPDLFLGYVYGICKNKVVDHYRRAGRDRSRPVDTLPDIVDPAASVEDRVVLRHDPALRALGVLPSRYRHILM